MVNIDYLYNPAAAKAHFEKKYFLDKKLGYRTIEHGIILSHSHTGDDGKWNALGYGGVVDSNGAWIKESFIHYGTGNKYTPRESILSSSETVIYIGLFYHLWGHDITDHIRRVWFIHSEEFKKNFKDCPIVYVPYGEGKLTLEQKPNFRRLLEIIGLDVEKIRPITQPTQFDKIILPDESFDIHSLGGFTSEYKETIDRVREFALKNRTPTSSPKIYYFHGIRPQMGEERLAEYFKSKGYAIIRPEKLSLDEQLNLLINCESFASTIGSCSHNAMFLRDGIETILIPRMPYWFTSYQQAIDQLNSLNAIYIDSTLSLIARAVHGPFCYVISEQLKNFFGDKFSGYEEEDFKIFLQYVRAPITKEINPSQLNSYGEVLQNFLAQLRKYEDLIVTYDMPHRWEYFRPLLNYQTHVGHKGWGSWNSEEEISNPLNQKFDIQAINIKFSSHKIYYSVYYNDEEGWSEEVCSPEMAGTTGKAKSIYGIKIRLDEAGAKEFDILYRVHKFDDTWTAWAKNGETIYSHGVKLNAIQIKLESKT